MLTSSLALSFTVNAAKRGLEKKYIGVPKKERKRRKKNERGREKRGRGTDREGDRIMKKFSGKILK